MKHHRVEERRVIRGTIVARYGGEECVVVDVPGSPGRAGLACLPARTPGRRTPWRKPCRDASDELAKQILADCTYELEYVAVPEDNELVPEPY